MSVRCLPELNIFVYKRLMCQRAHEWVFSVTAIFEFFYITTELGFPLGFFWVLSDVSIERKLFFEAAGRPFGYFCYSESDKKFSKSHPEHFNVLFSLDRGNN